MEPLPGDRLLFTHHGLHITAELRRGEDGRSRPRWHVLVEGPALAELTLPWIAGEDETAALNRIRQAVQAEVGADDPVP